MERKELTAVLPRNRDDAENANALIALGYPTVEPVLKPMLDWLKSNGSPVELVFRPFFAQVGAPALSLVKDALSSTHELWKFSIVRNVVYAWPRDLVVELQPHLEGLVQHSGFYSTDLVALEILSRHRLSEPSWLREWTLFKKLRLQEQFELLAAIELLPEAEL